MVNTKDNLNLKRKKEFLEIKELIKEHFCDGNCGLFNTRNFAGDCMNNIFQGDFFILDICYFWSYFEVFGTTSEEFEELYEFYNTLY